MKESTANFLLGVLAGAAAGAIVGILFAPDKGSKTRENIKKKIREISDDYGLGINELIDEMNPSETGKSRPEQKKKRKYTRKPKPAAE
jgi:gas vesicle protein